MKVIYILQMPNDVEGRSSRTMGYFTSQQAAIDAGKTEIGNQSMGSSNGYISTGVLYDSVQEYILEHRAQVRKQALAKLSSEERTVLGIEE